MKEVIRIVPSFGTPKLVLMEGDQCVQFLDAEIETSHHCDAMSTSAISWDERWIAVGSPNELYDLERTGVVYLFRLSPINHSFDLLLVLNTLEESTQDMTGFGKTIAFRQDGAGHILEVCDNTRKHVYSLQYTDVVKLSTTVTNLEPGDSHES